MPIQGKALLSRSYPLFRIHYPGFIIIRFLSYLYDIQKSLWFCSMGMNPFLGYYSFMAIETLVLVSVILSAVNAVILAAVLARGNSRKDIQRMSQEMQDRSASSFDAFRFSIEQRIQSLESAIKEINTSQREQHVKYSIVLLPSSNRTITCYFICVCQQMPRPYRLVRDG